MSRKKENDVRLTDAEIRKMKAGMTRSERKAFEKRQKQAEEDRLKNQLDS